MTRRILVVDDEEDAREMLVRGLVRLGWDATGAADGVEAIARLDAGLAAVVTDLLMPRADGFAVLDAARERAPSAFRVVVTAFGDKARVLDALNRGAHYLLEKPFGVVDLDTVLARLGAGRGDDEPLSALYQRALDRLDLGERDRQFVTLVLKGLPNREIAGVLGLGEQTVKNYLQGLYARLGIASRGELFHRVFPI